jgi:hypothetical protein
MTSPTVTIDWNVETKTPTGFPKGEQLRVKPRKVYDTVYDSLRWQARHFVQLELEKTVATWKDEKPKWDDRRGISISNKGGNITMDISPIGTEYAINKWMWLEGGTSRRWAVMSGGLEGGPKFVPKTRKNELKSYRGKGGAVLRGKTAMNQAGYTRPKPGIEPRNWLAIVHKKAVPLFIEYTDSILNEVFRRFVILDELDEESKGIIYR